ncbi:MULTISPECIES: daunorubicin resistance protein DrrA family ABC transporter ATP-binding protein [Nocardia]|uniref:Putative ABC transporter ATP-binding protein n=2 Tax=Nocardia TaxID=1817 RepID=Q5Z0D4_NOCFA|nr:MULTISPECIES: daunorubicin resistance protein DrrA family ABC transporter ATP-binding protein [Nocardia]MBA4854967.1 daunorubicin resistance protein DrrA family ABC transporter ATP-binding protein [Nocardia farcinica]MBC9816034.1 daunorubicin resistance protein DrrA family ABC transporter ATP-binding protein [Nocardia farcinica]MBF6186191.1 daunorubicin resistance protein DrrA family ABC transporter ATP-binding protein [Nocardia farcinica]MBF6252283.1 daunorubicin resistance protein DrrA fam
MTIPRLPALAVRDLHKSYGDHQVLTGIHLDVPAGTIFSLLGPNGAGKTTLVRILATLARPDAGEVRVFGHDLLREADTVRGLIGVTGQFAAVDTVLTGTENLRLTGRLLHLPAAEARRRGDDLLERFDLVDAAGKPAGSYSGGMRRRLDLAMSLMGRPRLVYLDEPTTGLDPRSRRDLWSVIRELAAEGTTILLTTQYLEEADQLADRIAVLDGGTIVAEGTPDELKQRVPGGHLRLRFADAATLTAAARALGDPAAAQPDPEQLALRIASDGSAGEIKAVLDRLAEHGVTIEQLAVHTPDLDDVFFALTGHPTQVETAA